MTLIALPERLTISEASATLTQLAEQLAGKGPGSDALTLDASALQQLDTSALAVLLACQRQAAGLGRPLRVEGAPAKLMQLAQLYGVESLLGT
jgi:phospholipid transport system transporter-binding protein